MPDDPPRPWRAPALAALAAACVVALTHLARPASPEARVDFPLDDAWIHLDYARGLLTDGYPSYNPGEPEAGFTSPLWLAAVTPVLTLCRALGSSPVIPVKLASLACAALAAAALGRLSARLGARPSVAALVALVSLLGPWCAESAPSAMEVPLALACCALALDAALARRALAAGVLLALAAWTRPESAVLTLGVVAWWALPRPRAVSPRDVAALLAPSAALGGAWVAWCLHVTGHPLPNTFYAKSGARDLGANALTLWRVLTEPGPAFALAFAALTLAGALALWRRDRRALALALSAPVALVASVVGSRHLSPDAAFCVRRYLYPFVPLLWPLAGVGLEALASRVKARWALPAVGAALALAALPSLAESRRRHAANSRDIAVFHTRPAEMLRAMSPPDAVVAAEGAGSSRFHSGRRVVDVIGLNAHRLVHARGRRMAYGCALARSGATWFALPTELATAFARVFDLTTVAVVRDDHYAQAIPPVPHRVVILRGAPRAEYLDRCRARFGDRGP